MGDKVFSKLSELAVIQSFSSKMDASVTVLVILLCVVSYGECIVCGQFDQCICSTVDTEVYCKGLAPIFAEKEDKHLIWDLQNHLEQNVDYADILSGYASVKLLHVPTEGCSITGLKEFLDCVMDPSPSSGTTERVETVSPSGEDDTTQNYGTGRIIKTSTMSVDFDLTDKAIVITLAINTAKLGFTAFLVYQILVSLVFIHSRINLLEGRSQKPSCVIACTHRWMKCIYCLCSCFCKCWSKRFKPPSFQGTYIYFHF